MECLTAYSCWNCTDLRQQLTLTVELVVATTPNPSARCLLNTTGANS